MKKSKAQFIFYFIFLFTSLSVISQGTQVYSTNTTITDDLSYDNVTVDSGVTLTIEKSGSLNISGTLTNNGAIVMNSASNEYSSLIAGAKAGSGGIYTYNKYISTVNTNDLISAPFHGQYFDDFYATLSPYAIFRNPGGSENAVLFGRFNNSTGNYTNNHAYGDNISQGKINAGEGFRVGSGIYKEDFSSSSFYNSNLEGVNQYLLNHHPQWGASTSWFIDNTNNTTHVSADWKKVVLKRGFSGLSQGDKITARIELNIEGIDEYCCNFSFARFGFSTNNNTGWGTSNSNFIF